MVTSRIVITLTVLSIGLAGCGDGGGRPYYDREIQPILTKRCTSSQSGPCHVDNGAGRAQGNLDLTSFEMTTMRPDVLHRFGSYPYPLLLLKALANPPEVEIPTNVGDGLSVPLFIRHAGGASLSVDDLDFRTLDEWLRGGATREGEAPAAFEFDPGPCSPVIRQDLFAQPTLAAIDVNSPQYQQFAKKAWPVLKKGCLGRECHGARDTNQVPTIELYFTCGDDENQMRFNYLMARTYSGEGGHGQLTQKALAGGSYHLGGRLFDSVDDPGYKAIRDWSKSDPPFALQTYEGATFFRANVQPMLVARGCYLEACHSLSNFNFYKPLAGTDGLYGTRVQVHNYLQARFLLGLESRDATQGRMLKKTLTPSVDGMLHRGGPLLAPLGNCELEVEEIRADPTRHWFEETSPGCLLHAWHQLERKIAIDAGQLNESPGSVGVFVRRPPNSDRHIDFDNYRPGADLLRLDLVLDKAGKVTGLAGEPTSLLGNCGVKVQDADVRRPDINPKGTEVIFAMRTSMGEGLDIWRVKIDGSDCARIGLEGGTDAVGTPLHHFDPAYAPGGVLLFASSMGDVNHADPERRYPSRTPKWFLPNANVWVYAEGAKPRRISYLSGSELAPRMLHSREVIYAVEKAAPDFYQISTRAIGVDDGGGYRPELGQRPKMGYGQVTEMRELVDFRTTFIASDPGTYFGGGTLGVHDLTLGLEELEFDDSFMHPVRILDPEAAARPGEMGTGAYRSPTPLADGRILVAYSPGMVDLGNMNAKLDYGLWIVDPSGAVDPVLLYDSPGQFDIEPVVAYPRIWVPQPNRVHQGILTRGEYVFHSIPLFAVMMNDNTRQGSVPNDKVVAMRVLEQLSPPEGVSSPQEVAADLYGPQQVYVKRRLIGQVSLLADGSLRFKVPASTPLVLELLDKNGAVIDRQREEEQLGPGETQPRMIQPAQFNGICGGCHNAIDGSELGVAIGADVLTGASTRSAASQATAVDLYTEPANRPVVVIND